MLIWFDGILSSYISISYNGDFLLDVFFSIFVWIYKILIYGFGGYIVIFEFNNGVFFGLQFYGIYLINLVVGKLYFLSFGEIVDVGNFKFMFFNFGFW